MRIIKALIILFVLGVTLNSCRVSYSFTGVSLDPRIKTISVENFYNEAYDGPANMSILFTETLRDYFQKNTPLSLVGEGDLQFSGSVTKYDVSPVAPRAGDEIQTAQLQRLTIEVKVSFVNNFDDEKSFEKAFSQFEDFDANVNLQSVEAELIDTIFDRIVFDIFNKSVADW